MNKKELCNSIKEKDKDKILKNLNEVCRDENLWDDCFQVILDLLYLTEDKELINQIDLTMYFILKSSSIDKMLKIINHEKYTFEKIKSFSHIYNVIFHNNSISTQLYKTLILNNAEKYSQELMQLLESTTIDVSKLELTCDEKILIFYKTMGLICAHIRNNMNLCFKLLEDNELIKKDSNLLLTFVRFYGWNWMGTSSKFINEVDAKSDSQKQLIELLKLYIEGVKEENFGKSTSTDFDIDLEIIRAKRRVELEQSKKIRKQADEHSLFLSLFPATHLLIGNKVSYFYENNEKVYQKEPSPLHEFNYELEIPLDYIITPIDFQYTLNYLLKGGKHETDN